MKDLRWLPLGLTVMLAIPGCSPDALKALMGSMPQGTGGGPGGAPSASAAPLAGQWFSCDGGFAEVSEDPQGNVTGDVKRSDGTVTGQLSGHASGTHVSLDYLPVGAQGASPQPEHFEGDVNGSLLSGTTTDGSSTVHMSFTRQAGAPNPDCGSGGSLFPPSGPSPSPSPSPSGPSPTPTPTPTAPPTVNAQALTFYSCPTVPFDPEFDLLVYPTGQVTANAYLNGQQIAALSGTAASSGTASMSAVTLTVSNSWSTQLPVGTVVSGGINGGTFMASAAIPGSAIPLGLAMASSSTDACALLVPPTPGPTPTPTPGITVSPTPTPPPTLLGSAPPPTV